MRPRYSILRPGPAIGCHSNCRLRGGGGAGGRNSRQEVGPARLLAVCSRVGWRRMNHMCGCVPCAGEPTGLSDPSVQGWLF